MSRCQPRIMAPGIRWTRPSIIQSSSRLANCLRATGFLKAKSTQFLLDRQRWQDVVELWWVFLFLLGHSFSSRLIRMPAASKMSMALINASHLQASCVHVFLDMTDTNMVTYYTITHIKIQNNIAIQMFSSLSTHHACASWYCDSKQGNKTCWWRLVASGRSQAYARPLWRTRKCHSSKNCWTIKPTVTSSTWKRLKQVRTSHQQKTIWHVTLFGLCRDGPK